MWNDEMEKLLGIRPRTYSEGVLQDIHWSLGSIGYFPTYTLGTLVSAQVRYHLERDIGSLPEKVSSGDYQTIKDYLREKVHRWGSTYPPKELLSKSFNEEFNPDHFIDYLKKKYLTP
jgi:carboxypeptidase Taq